MTWRENWLEPNKLNENGAGWYNQLTRSHEEFGEFDEVYKNDPWWREMKQRMEDKNEKQIELDRRLLEQAGTQWSVNGKWPKVNLKEIKKLISMGAQPDHWVEDEYNSLSNTIMSTVNKDSDQDANELAKLFYEKFRKFGITDRSRVGGRRERSMLGMTPFF